ncbi:MAG: hypothetical protein M1820_007691 [Bogoriella megaspora]|nr:MAG: hypothetical protein M1820_007691 [Bogoriella megaspora]
MIQTSSIPHAATSEGQQQSSTPPPASVPNDGSKNTNSREKRKNNHSSSHQTHTNLTLSHPRYTYLHLTLISSTSITTATPNAEAAEKQKQSPIDLDALTIRTYLASALSSFLGLTGSAIPIDILKHSGMMEGENNVWIRVPNEDGSAVVAALGAWVGKADKVQGGALGWRIKGRANWLPALVGAKDGGPRSLFEGFKNTDAAE